MKKFLLLMVSIVLCAGCSSSTYVDDNTGLSVEIPKGFEFSVSSTDVTVLTRGDGGQISIPRDWKKGWKRKPFALDEFGLAKVGEQGVTSLGNEDFQGGKLLKIDSTDYNNGKEYVARRMFYRPSNSPETKDYYGYFELYVRAPREEADKLEEWSRLALSSLSPPTKSGQFPETTK